MAKAKKKNTNDKREIGEMKNFTGFILLFCLITLAACSQDHGGSKVVAKVNGEEITQEQYNFAFQAKKRELESRHPVKASKLFHQTLARQTINDLVMRTLILQAANKEGIKITKQEVSVKLEQVKASFKDKNAFQEALKRAGISQDVLWREIEEGLTIEKHRQRLLKNVRVSEKEARVYYNQNSAQFKLPEEYKVSFILAKAEKEAQELSAKLKKGQVKFDQLVKTHPVPFPQGGSEAGWVEPSFLPRSFTEAIKNTRPGTIAGPVKGKAGFYLLRVEEIRSSGIEPFELAQKKIIHVLTEKKKQAAMNDWLVKQKKNARIEIYLKG